MRYLNILIGFSFLMLVFAIAVSIAQGALSRALSLKGQALVPHLLRALQDLWARHGLPPRSFGECAAALTAQLATRGGKHARTLNASAVGNRQVTAAILRQFGKDELPNLLIGASAKVDMTATWDRIVDDLERGWGAVATLASASYTANTKRYLLGLSAVVVLACNVDAIRILRVLAVDPKVRAELVADASQAEATARLTTWQQQNVTELQATGLPLGWGLAPLWVCDGGATATYQHPCVGDVAVWNTAQLWLVCVLGLALGIGLVSQGAPFWLSLLQTELGIKNAQAPPSPSNQPPAPTPAPAPAPTPAPAPAPPPVIEPIPGSPVLITDIYSDEDPPRWADFAASSTFTGVILKATDGVSFAPAGAWFVPQWQAARAAAGARYRQTLFLGAYHWLELYDDPVQQADFYSAILAQAGWGPGDMLPIVDLEFGSNGPHPAPNYRAWTDRDASRVIACTSQYVARLKHNLGADTGVILYSGQVLRDLQIKDHMGCDYLWMANYGVSQPSLSGLYSLGWSDAQIVMWQYSDGDPGSNQTRSPQLPDNVPGMGPRDCSKFRGGGLAQFQSLLIKR
ncbi:MAG TPA: GH25 family lysozyme [Kofleriaceae bacterium]|nr:GH25 family lysozyme [Kofleriaceae bacterium]